MATQNPKTTPIAPPVQTTVQYHSNDFDFEEWRAEVETRELCKYLRVHSVTTIV